MRARVTHTLTYRYSAPVLLGPHRFCLRPRGHGFQHLRSFELSVTPEPSRLYPLIAASGDEILRARFLERHGAVRGEGHQCGGHPGAGTPDGLP